MTTTPLKTPVLFLIFNRPDETQQVFNEIRRAQPSHLFVSADGPRPDRAEDIELCRKTREIVQQVDWDCTVKIRFLDENLGCKKGVSSAIDWFFTHVEEGIILEDDCVPDQTFFAFCQELLAHYRDDTRIMMITGTNYLIADPPMEESYLFSKYYIIWGWATWRRAWRLYDITMSEWPKLRDSNQLDWIYPDKKLVQWYNTMMQSAYDEKIDTWDIQWWYTCIFQNGLSIVPKFNLISNIGSYGHFAGSNDGAYDEFIKMPTKSFEVKSMAHPSCVVENPRYDRPTINRLLGEETGIKPKILATINRMLEFFSVKIILSTRY